MRLGYADDYARGCGNTVSRYHGADNGNLVFRGRLPGCYSIGVFSMLTSLELAYTARSADTCAWRWISETISGCGVRFSNPFVPARRHPYYVDTILTEKRTAPDRTPRLL